MPRIVTSAYVTPGTACLIAHLAASAEISERAMAARASTPPIRCSGPSAFTWMDQGCRASQSDPTFPSARGEVGPGGLVASLFVKLSELMTRRVAVRSLCVTHPTERLTAVQVRAATCSIDKR
jgi:hypothetical protein